LSTLLLVMATLRATWRSKAAAIALIFAMTAVLGWLALFLRSLLT
jgi:hypothetical protein